MSTVAVVGAGPAGLIAAWHAARAGHEVTIVERSDRVGGMAASHEVAGLRVDLGSHRLHPSTPPSVRAELDGLLGADLQVRPRHGRIRLQGRWIAFPLRTGDLLGRLPRGFAARAALDAATGPLRRPRADTFAEVVRAGLGPTVAGEFYEPYVRKIWGVPADELAGELARRRVSASSPADVVRKLVRGSRPEGRTFLYPRRGFGQIAERLAEAAVDAGATVRLGTAVERVQFGSGPADPATLVLAGGSELVAEHVWSTAPLPELARRSEPPPPAGVLDAADRLEHRGLALVYLVLPTGRWTEFDAHYFPAADVPLARLSEPRNYRTSAEDPTDRTVLCAEVPCTAGDLTWSSSDADLGAMVSDAIAAQGLPPAVSDHVEVVRLPRVYPVYRPDTAWDLSALELWSATQPGLRTFGRQGLFVPDNTHHALQMGVAAAAALGRPGEPFDQTAWEAARAGFRSFVVED